MLTKIRNFGFALVLTVNFTPCSAARASCVSDGNSNGATTAFQVLGEHLNPGLIYGDMNPVIIENVAYGDTLTAEEVAQFRDFKIVNWNRYGETDGPLSGSPDIEFPGLPTNGRADVALITPVGHKDTNHASDIIWKVDGQGLFVLTAKNRLGTTLENESATAETALAKLMKRSRDGEVNFQFSTRAQRDLFSKLSPALDAKGRPLVSTTEFLDEFEKSIISQTGLAAAERKFLRSKIEEVIENAPQPPAGTGPIGRPIRPTGIILRWKESGKGQDFVETHTDRTVQLTGTMGLVGYSSEIFRSGQEGLKIIRPKTGDTVYFKNDVYHRASTWREDPRLIVLVFFD